MKRDDLLSLRAMLAYALLYHGGLLILVAIALLRFPAAASLLVIAIAFFAWMAGGQLVAWIYDERWAKEDRR